MNAARHRNCESELRTRELGDCMGESPWEMIDGEFSARVLLAARCLSGSWSADCDLLEQPDRSSDLLERRHREVEIRSAVRRRHLAAHASMPLRYHRKSEAGHEHTLSQHPLAPLGRERCLADDDGHYRWIARQRRESRLRDCGAKVLRVVVQL